MSSTEKLFEATLNRLGVRIEKSLINSAAKISEIAKVAPKKLQEQWELFQEEVIEEANRLEKESEGEKTSTTKEAQDSKIQDPYSKVKHIRAKVTELNEKLEAKN